jgi:hypothetical protein
LMFKYNRMYRFYGKSVTVSETVVLL